MDQRLPIDSRSMLLMVMLCSIWALQQVALKATALDFSPMLQTSLRCGAGAVLVALFVLYKNNGGLQPNLAQLDKRALNIKLFYETP
jgi:drug/metabolite transporter (DMT)-like permease